jgi:putative two-component system response regulator
LAAPMHDIGKIGLPDAILRKQGTLTPDERKVMERHTVLGAALLTGSNSAVLNMGREIAMCHHERWDGSGYPHGIAGEAVPEAARILSIADVYDALMHDRIYRRALPEDVVLQMMSAEAGQQFDPSLMVIFFTVLEAFREISEKHPDALQRNSSLHRWTAAHGCEESSFLLKTMAECAAPEAASPHPQPAICRSL